MKIKKVLIQSIICLVALGVQAASQNKDMQIMNEKVSFKNGFWKMAGDLYLPPAFDSNNKYSAIVIVHPGGGVKEQTAGLYARRLAEKGFITLAFDATHQGESEGEPRRLDSPNERVEDVKCAADYLTTLRYVNREAIGAMGICAGGGYAINAALTEKRIKAVAGVSPVDAGLSTRNGWAGKNTLANQLKLMEEISAARTAEANGEPAKLVNYVPENVDEDTPRDFAEAHGYYRTKRGGHPNSDNLCLQRGFADRLAFNSFALIPDFLTQPLLVVVGENAASRWMGEKAVALSTHEKELYVVDGGTHISLYDVPDDVNAAVSKLDEFFKRHLGGQKEKPFMNNDNVMEKKSKLQKHNMECCRISLSARRFQ